MKILDLDRLRDIDNVHVVTVDPVQIVSGRRFISC